MVEAHLKLHHDDLKAPGDYQFTVVKVGGPPAGIIYVCPCGCGDQGYLRIDGPHLSEEDRGRPKWQWNSNKEKPTLTPSILSTRGCKWHGYLIDGIFKAA